jgi:hypothetical protein
MGGREQPLSLPHRSLSACRQQPLQQPLGLHAPAPLTPRGSQLILRQFLQSVTFTVYCSLTDTWMMNWKYWDRFLSGMPPVFAVAGSTLSPIYWHLGHFRNPPSISLQERKLSLLQGKKSVSMSEIGDLSSNPPSFLFWLINGFFFFFPYPPDTFF